MRLLPRSLAGRLAVTAGLAVAIALAVASLAVGRVLERFVTAGLDQRLDAQLAVLARAVRPDGRLDPAVPVDVPPFDRPADGWTWRATAAPLGPPEPPSPPGPDAGRPRPFEGRTPEGERVHGRMLTLPTPAGPVTLVATGPRRLIEQPLREAAAPLLLSVALLGGLLAAAVLVQLRIGLRPVARLGGMLGEVRAGTRARVEVEEPSELLPLVAAVNALLDANEAQLARARLHASNLAHGLKTPLAALRLELADPARDPDGRLGSQVARLEAQVRHHLARARTADRRGTPVPAVPLAPAVAGIAAALARIHADRGVAATLDVPATLTVRCDPQDLDEAIGNLMDNGWHHARARLSVTAARDGGRALIRIEDDGDTLSDDALAALDAGGRPADERPGGHGQGLRIAREVVELHGGTLTLARAPAGGLGVLLTLPAGPG